MFSRLIAYVRGVRRREVIDGEAGEELQFHIECETDANMARGMSYAEARRTALMHLGGVTQTRERIRDVRTIGFGEVARDVRYGTRALAAAPRFTAVALLTIVMMVGGISTIYTLVQGVLLRPLPYPDANRLVIVESTQPKGFGTSVTLADALTFRDHADSFDQWGLFRVGYVGNVIDANNEPLPVQDIRVTPDVFPMFGIGTALGRALLSSDAAAAEPAVAVISHDLWQTLFAGDPNVVGRTLMLNRDALTVVGVSQPGANVPTNWLTYPIVWRPARDAADRDTRFTAMARLRPGASIERGKAQLAVLAERLAVAHPETHEGRTAGARLLLDRIVGDFKRVLWIFFSAVACVVLIGLGNLTSLQLARNGTRDREITLRAALGASRWQVVRQLLVESVVLCGVGGVLGLAAAWPAVKLIAATLPTGFPRADQIRVDLGVALFACGVSLVVAVVVGTLSAWHAWRGNLTTRLNEGGRTAMITAARGRMQRALIAFQTAVALMLLIGAGLLGNSFQRLISRDAGMREDGLWTVVARLPLRYRDNAAQTAFWTSALEQVTGINGVESAAVAVNSSGPLSGGDISDGGVVPEGVTPGPRVGVSISSRRVSENYFQTIGMPLLKGRPILASDTAGAESVVVINDLAAAVLWPGQDPIGKRLRSARGDLKTVVGVIPTFRHSRLDGDFSPQMYTPYLQRPSVASSAVLMFRAAPGNSEPAAAVASLLTALEKDLHVTVSSMRDVRWRLLAKERFRVAVILTFAASAVFLALVGIFGLVAYTVGQRQREIAVRVTLGAVRRDVLRIASQHAIAPAFLGLALGILGATMATRLLASFLVDIQPIDLPTFALAAGALGCTALIAGVVPARQALRIDPAETLRAE
jgi:putative ABC transport system permease protein